MSILRKFLGKAKLAYVFKLLWFRFFSVVYWFAKFQATIICAFVLKEQVITYRGVDLTKYQTFSRQYSRSLNQCTFVSIAQSWVWSQLKKSYMGLGTKSNSQNCFFVLLLNNTNSVPIFINTGWQKRWEIECLIFSFKNLFRSSNSSTSLINEMTISQEFKPHQDCISRRQGAVPKCCQNWPKIRKKTHLSRNKTHVLKF